MFIFDGVHMAFVVQAPVAMRRRVSAYGGWLEVAEFIRDWVSVIFRNGGKRAKELPWEFIGADFSSAYVERSCDMTFPARTMPAPIAAMVGTDIAFLPYDANPYTPYVLATTPAEKTVLKAFVVVLSRMRVRMPSDATHWGQVDKRLPTQVGKQRLLALFSVDDSRWLGVGVQSCSEYSGNDVVACMPFDAIANVPLTTCFELDESGKVLKRENRDEIAA